MQKIDWDKLSAFKGPEESPGFLLWQVSTAWRRKVETALLELGLTHPQFVLLASLAWLTRNGDFVSQVDLAKHCKKDVNLTSQVLRTLEGKGFLSRVQLPGNERSKFPQVTDKGLKKVKEALPIVEEIDNTFFKPVHNKETLFLELLSDLIK